MTYSVKYYGVNEGQIGILSRRVPFDEFGRPIIKTDRPQRLPKAVSVPKLPPIKRKSPEPPQEEEYEEVEVTDEESDEDLPPIVSKPKPLDLI